MGLETFNFIDSLVVTNPDGATDQKLEGDNHLRGIKTTLKNSFPNITGAMTATQTELNVLDGITKSTTHLNSTSTIYVPPSVTLTTAGTSLIISNVSTNTEIITIIFDQVRCSSTGAIVVELGDPTVETTGYISTISRNVNGTLPVIANSPSGFPVTNPAAINEDVSGIMTITHITGNTWIMQSSVSYVGALTQYISSGTKTLTGGPLSIIQLSILGAGNFNLGQVKVFLQGQ